MKRSHAECRAAVVVLLFLFVSPVVAADDGGRARELLRTSIEAVGGMEKLTGWETRTEAGLMTTNWPGWGELRANCEQIVKRPDKLKYDHDFSAYDHPFFFVYYYNAGEVWAVINLGVRQHQRYTEWLTDEIEKIDGVAYYLTHCDTFFIAGAVPDDSLFAGSELDRIGVVDDGDTVLIDVEKRSHLPVRRIEQGGRTHLIFADYRDSAGLKVPYRVMVYEDGQVSSTFTWDRVEFDLPIDDAVFEEYRPAPENASG